MKLLNKFFVLSISMFASSLLFAHAKLIEASPANGAVVNESPASITLSFNEDVQLLKVTLIGTDNKPVDTGFEASAASQTSFVVALPELAKDVYTVNWTIMGDDGHKVEEHYTFSVDAAAPAKTGSIGGESHAEHSH